jgi:hypothetical protein
VLKPGGHVALTDLFKIDDSAGGANFMSQELVRLADYDELTKAAGLGIDELLDVSAHTRRTYSAMAEGISRGTDEIKAQFGDGVINLLQAVAAPFGPAATVGCLILAAHRV